MQLIEFIELFDENKTLIISDFASCEIIATYDGKNSIDEDLNSEQIKHITLDENKAIIYIR